MKVQIWLDFVCPFCYAGETQLKNAIKEVDENIEVELMSYELAPGAEDNNDLFMNEVLEERFGMKPEDVKRDSVQVKKMIHDVGLEINSDETKFCNTLKAHALLQYAKENDLSHELADALYHAYFVEGAYLNKDETLVEIANSVGIDEETVKTIIASKEYQNKANEDRRLGEKNGVEAVPHVVINGDIQIKGAQSEEVYKEALSKAVEQ